MTESLKTRLFATPSFFFLASLHSLLSFEWSLTCPTNLLRQNIVFSHSEMIPVSFSFFLPPSLSLSLSLLFFFFFFFLTQYLDTVFRLSAELIILLPGTCHPRSSYQRTAR